MQFSPQKMNERLQVGFKSLYKVSEIKKFIEVNRMECVSSCIYGDLKENQKWNW
jgi:hypothetical protein